MAKTGSPTRAQKPYFKEAPADHPFYRSGSWIGGVSKRGGQAPDGAPAPLPAELEANLPQGLEG